MTTNSSRTAVLDVQQFIDAHPLSRYQWLLLLLSFLIMVADGFDTAAIGFVAPVLSKEWGVVKLALGPVLSASLAGMALGALAAGPIADRFGRRPVLLIAVLAFGAFSLGSSYAGSITSLTAWRFLTGLGLGAATPIATTLLSESSPSRRRALLLNFMFCGFSLGAALGGFGAAMIIPHFGWRGMFLAGAVAPLVLVTLSWFALRESVRFLVFRNAPAEVVRAVLRHVTGASEVNAARFTTDAPPAGVRGSSVALMFSSGYRTGTLMLWITYFAGVLVFYLTTSWLPTLIRDSGLPMRQTSMLTALLPLGGALGAVVCGWLMDRVNPHRAIAAAFFFNGVSVWVLGQSVNQIEYLPALTFASGFFNGAALVSMPALAASYYPTQGRASGVAWMLGIGRFGGIAGAMLGGLLMQLEVGTEAILGLLAIPAFAGTAALLCKDISDRRQPTSSRAVAWNYLE